MRREFCCNFSCSLTLTPPCCSIQNKLLLSKMFYLEKNMSLIWWVLKKALMWHEVTTIHVKYSSCSSCNICSIQMCVSTYAYRYFLKNRPKTKIHFQLQFTCKYYILFEIEVVGGLFFKSKLLNSNFLQQNSFRLEPFYCAQWEILP